MKNLILICLILTGCSGTLSVNNDLFGGRKTDQSYTHGTKFSYDIEKDTVKETYAVGQTMFTPATKHPDADPALLAKDRPYAGYLFGEYRHSEQVDPIVQNTWGVQVGCVGNCSFAKETQQGFHRLIGQDEPDWPANNPIRSEPVAMLQLEQKRKQYSHTFNEYVATDVSAYGAGKIGTIVNSLGLGGEGRLGYNLPYFAPDEIIFRIPKEQNPYSAYAYLKGEERYVPYNHLLDGSLFQREKHTVDSKDFVEEMQAGVSFGYKQFKLGYTYVLISSEWTTSPSSFTFGSIQLSW